MNFLAKITAAALAGATFFMVSVPPAEARRSGRNHGEFATGKSGGVYNGLLGPAYDYHGCYEDEDCGPGPLVWRRAWRGHYYYD